jgi:predicted acyl esterase
VSGPRSHVVKAHDGVNLYTDTWLPAPKNGNVPPARVPVVLALSPYLTKGSMGPIHLSKVIEPLVSRGYAFTNAHVRGTGGSGGCVEQIAENEVDDGSRLVEYFGRDAPWTTGSVGMYGTWYTGGTSLAVAALGDPVRTQYLKAIVSGASLVSWYDYYFQDGVPKSLRATGTSAAYFATFSMIKVPGTGGGPGEYSQKPGCQGGVLASSLNVTGDFTDFAAARDTRKGVHNITAPVLAFHGHVNVAVPAIMQAGLFDRLPATTPRAGVFGVFDNEWPDEHDFQTPPVAPDWERVDWLDMVVAWYDRWLKVSSGTNVDDWPVVQVQGTDGQWRAEPDWPTTGGPAGQLALGPGGDLGVSTPSGSTSYVESMLETTQTEEFPPGTAAVFETAPLTDRLEVTGQPVLDLWLSLDRPDAHLAAKVEGIGPDGAKLPYARTVGTRSMQHLDPLTENRFTQREGKLAPMGVPVRVTLRLNPTDIVVPAGGRLRITIAGSVIMFDGLDGVGEGLGAVFQGPSQPSGTATRVTILHDCAHPSALRFLMPRADADLLNVREKDEPAGEPLADNRPHAALATDGGGLAVTPVCGQPPERNEVLGPLR